MANLHFNHLSPAELERLAILSEEAAEVQKAIGKILRHGYDSYNPDDIGRGSNRLQLQEECGDLLFAIRQMCGTETLDLDLEMTPQGLSANTIGRGPSPP